MVEPHHLRDAPIRECLIDIFVDFPKDQQQHVGDALKVLKDRVAETYPNVQDLREAQIQVDLDRKKGIFEGSITGYRCFNAERNRAVQFRLNGFTFNRLRPYEQWQDFRDAAQEMWQLYVDVARPVRITKLGLRYINDLTFPTTSEEFSFSDYLVTEPAIPSGVPQTVSRFLTRVTVVDEANDSEATITHAFEGRGDPKELKIILDIDTGIRGEIDPSDPSIWDKFDYLRHFKNRIFFGSLTEKAVRLFE